MFLLFFFIQENENKRDTGIKINQIINSTPCFSIAKRTFSIFLLVVIDQESDKNIKQPHNDRPIIIYIFNLHIFVADIGDKHTRDT
jgi:hypothetical protein